MYLLGPQDLVHCFDAGAGQEMQGEGQECAREAELTFLEWKVVPERVVEEDILCSVCLCLCGAVVAVGAWMAPRLDCSYIGRVWLFVFVFPFSHLLFVYTPQSPSSCCSPVLFFFIWRSWFCFFPNARADLLCRPLPLSSSPPPHVRTKDLYPSSYYFCSAPPLPHHSRPVLGVNVRYEILHRTHPGFEALMPS